VIEVAAAAIPASGWTLLLAQRPPGKVYAGYWEFPGGKIEPGEPPSARSPRELHEELGHRRAGLLPVDHARVRLSARPRAAQFFPGGSNGSATRSRAKTRRSPGRRSARPMAAPMLRRTRRCWHRSRWPHEYAITDAARVGIAAMLEALERRLEQGLKLVQVREPALDAAARELFTTQAIGLAHRYRCKGDGEGASRRRGRRALHRGGAHAARAAAARRAGGGLVHTRAELERAMALELDFAVLGPVLEKSGAAALGWEGFAAIGRGSSIPVYAIAALRPPTCSAHGVRVRTASP